MNLTHVITTLADGLNGEFLQGHFSADNGLQRTDGRIHRTVSAGSCLKVFVGDEQTHTGHTLHTLTGGYLQIVELDVVSGSTVGTGQYHDVIICHLLLLVSQFQEVFVNLVQLLAIQFHSVHAQAMAKGSTSATGSQYDGIVIDTHFLGVHNLISGNVLQHSILMDTTTVGKRILTHNGLVGLNGHVHQRTYHTAGGINLCGVDVGFNTQVGMGLENHGHLFQTGVSGTFANTVDGNLHLTGTIEHTGNGICGCHTQVVVAMGRQDACSGRKSVYMLIEILNLLAIFIGSAETCCVRNVADGCSSLADCINHACQILIVCTACILGIELHILHITLGIFHGSHGTFYNLLGIAVELISDVRRACTDSGMNTLAFGILQSISRHINVLLYGTGKRTNGGPCYRFGNFNYRVEVARTTYRESGFNHIHTQGFKLLGYLNLLYCIELASRHLFTIAQGGVKNKQSVTHIS